MVCPQIPQLDMTYLRINPAGQLLVSHNGGVLHTPLFLQLDYIIAVGGKLLAAVGGYTLSAFFLKGCGE